jgi:hypothetical protein
MDMHDSIPLTRRAYRTHLARWSGAIAATLLLALDVAPAQAADGVDVTTGVAGCHVLYAGSPPTSNNSIEVGEVCFQVAEDAEHGHVLHVTYDTTDSGWTLNTVHFWSGEDPDGYPQAGPGNPKLGHFPYKSGDLGGATYHEFDVPLAYVMPSLGSIEDLECGWTGSLYAMAYASVQGNDGEEGAWAGRDFVMAPRGDRGNWHTRVGLMLTASCDEPPTDRGQETAMMLGNVTLDDNPHCTVPAERWGWFAGPLGPDHSPHVREIYAAAGQNDTGNGTLVGHATIIISHIEGWQYNASVAIEMLEGFKALEKHFYISNEAPCSSAFGKYWNSEPVVSGLDYGIFVGVHLSVEGDCQENGNFCLEENEEQPEEEEEL